MYVSLQHHMYVVNFLPSFVLSFPCPLLIFLPPSLLASFLPLSVVAKKLGCRLKIKLRRLKEGLKCQLCFTDSSPAKIKPLIATFSAGEFCRQPVLNRNTALFAPCLPCFIVFVVLVLFFIPVFVHSSVPWFHDPPIPPTRLQITVGHRTIIIVR